MLSNVPMRRKSERKLSLARLRVLCTQVLHCQSFVINLVPDRPLSSWFRHGQRRHTRGSSHLHVSIDGGGIGVVHPSDASISIDPTQSSERNRQCFTRPAVAYVLGLGSYSIRARLAQGSA